MMISPNELRIGDWVKWPGEKEPNEVQWQHGHWLGVFKGNYSFPEPIPLTEEWLVKFGFELHPWGWVKHSFLIRWSKTKFWLEVGNGTRIEFAYVHTLQNFFSLTGTELQIK